MEFITYPSSLIPLLFVARTADRSIAQTFTNLVVAQKRKFSIFPHDDVLPNYSSGKVFTPIFLQYALT